MLSARSSRARARSLFEEKQIDFTQQQFTETVLELADELLASQISLFAVSNPESIHAILTELLRMMTLDFHIPYDTLKSRPIPRILCSLVVCYRGTLTAFLSLQFARVLTADRKHLVESFAASKFIPLMADIVIETWSDPQPETEEAASCIANTVCCKRGSYAFLNSQKLVQLHELFQTFPNDRMGAFLMDILSNVMMFVEIVRGPDLDLLIRFFHLIVITPDLKPYDGQALAGLLHIIRCSPRFIPEFSDPQFAAIVLQKIQCGDPHITCPGIHLIIQILKTEWHNSISPFITWEWIIAMWEHADESIRSCLTQLGFQIIRLTESLSLALSSGFLARVATLFTNATYDTRCLIADQFTIGLAVAPADMAAFLAFPPILEVLIDLLSACDEKGAFPILKICGFLLAVQSETHALDLNALDIGDLAAYVESSFARADLAALAAEVAALL
jgi:hypothetical protein